MDQLQIIYLNSNGNKMSFITLMSVKHLFIIDELNKSLLTLQSQKHNSVFAAKESSVWN
jgi:hypothetical protein